MIVVTWCFLCTFDVVQIEQNYTVVGGWTNPSEKYESKLEIFPKQGWK